MQQLAVLRFATGVVLVASGAIVATPVTVPPPDVAVSAIQLTAGEQDIVIDFVRHGQSADNVASILGTVAPGAPLTATGEQEANTVGQALFNLYGGPDGVAGIFASGLIRTQETAAPFAGLEQMPVTALSGLNELNAGILEGAHQTDVTGLAYLAAPLAWILGLYLVPKLGSSDYDGAAFETYFGDAVKTMYTEAMANPVVSANGQITDVAFSHAAAIATWVMMNVKNPDFALFFSELTKGLLPNTGQIVIEGNPTDGWTLESYNGTAVPPASFFTELFVDVRNLITAPQMALHNVWLSIIGAEPTSLTSAIQSGFDQVGAAMVQFPESVLHGAAAALGTGLVPLEPGPVITDALAAI